jgi:serine/threonine protein kinase
MSKGKHGRRRARRTAPRGTGAVRCGRYELLQPLGAGGMAEVFKARVSGVAGFQREVVLKRLHASRNDDPEFVNMFTDEARILGMLHHPNIVQALDFGEEDDKLFLVLEYVEGPSLARVMRDRRGISPAIVAYLGREICRALDYMHGFKDGGGTALKLIHRDVTPANIIVTPTGTVKLLDFGIAKFVKATQSTQAGTVKGKSAYLAPEQLLGEGPIDGRVDLFALGTVLHELLSGERLFASDSDLSTMRRIMDMKIPPPSSKLAGVPPALDRVIMRALERDPSKRYASAAEMARDLDDVVLAAGLRVDDVAAFVRDVEHKPAGQPWSAGGRLPTTEEREAPTRRDRLLPVRRWMSDPPSVRRAALVAALTLALAAAGGLRWNMKAPATATATARARAETVATAR